jgi:hypothetical protein
MYGTVCSMYYECSEHIMNIDEKKIVQKKFIQTEQKYGVKCKRESE